MVAQRSASSSARPGGGLVRGNSPEGYSDLGITGPGGGGAGVSGGTESLGSARCGGTVGAAAAIFGVKLSGGGIDEPDTAITSTCLVTSRRYASKRPSCSERPLTRGNSVTGSGRRRSGSRALRSAAPRPRRKRSAVFAMRSDAEAIRDSAASTWDRGTFSRSSVHSIGNGSTARGGSTPRPRRASNPW